jgi:hypothetical protein
MQMQLLLEQLQCRFLPHFADAAGHADVTGDSLTNLSGDVWGCGQGRSRDVVPGGGEVPEVQNSTSADVVSPLPPVELSVH